tara:strand:+ start:1829 stop:2224 length:396 start_codon:yes stop_codon:yes gene_type:complete
MKHVDDNLTDLYLLSMLPEGVKVSIRNGRIVHERPKSGEGVMSFVASSFNSLRRWYNNDNRMSGINEIYTVVHTSFKILDETSDDKLIQRYKVLFPKVIEGIENFMRTYKDDAYIVSRCNIIIDNTRDYDW